jgi:hypothetical protein
MIRPTPLLLITLLLTFVCGCLPASAQSVWTRQTLSLTDDLTGIVYGNGQFVAVGDPGVIITSPDGTTWTSRTSGTSNPLRGIAYGNGLYVATGSAGTLLTSPDGIIWTTRDAQTGTLLSGAAFGNGKFVVVGGSGTVRYSTDGVTWQPIVAPPTVSSLQGVCFGGGQFVAVGASGAIIRSADGQTWSLATSGAAGFDYLFAASYLNGTYAAVGSNGAIFTSPDADTWTRQSIVAFTRLRGITNNGQQFVAIGDPLPDDSISGKVLTSTDGSSWGVTDLASDSSGFFGIGYGAKTYVIVGAATASNPIGLVLTSEDDLAVSLGFEAWRQAEFTVAELADPLISGAEADPDLDGLKNFLEYALGLPPKVSTPGTHEALPKLEKSAGGWTMTFMRPENRVGEVTYSLFYATTDLSNWLPLNVPEQIESEDAGIQTVKFTDPDISSLMKFYRLVVEDL